MPPFPSSHSASGLLAVARLAFSLDRRGLALFRIAAGCLLVGDAGLRSRDFWLFLSPEGVFPLPVLRGYLGPGCWSLSFLSADLGWQGAVLAFEAVAGAALAVGLCTPLVSLLAWVAWVSLLRRTAPALNAGDYWLACLLFWGMFLPLGDRWSLDARRRPTPPAARVCSLASLAFVCQVLVVYLVAGTAKLNGAWLDGTAVGFTLSPHDHGTSWGTWLGETRWLIPPLTWGTLLLELLGPLVYLGWNRPGVRRSVAVAFMLFHLLIWSMLSVGLFAPVGIAAWLPLLFPPPVSDRSLVASRCSNSGRGGARLRAGVVAGAGIIALLALGWATLRTRQPAPAWLNIPVNLLCLDQSWAMFGDARPVEQWATARAVLADGRVVDLLRRGRPFQPVRPAGGFGSLPNHRWHKLFWELPKPRQQSLRPAVAAGLAADWNRRHQPDAAVRSLEIRFTRVSHPGRPHPNDFPRLDAAGSAAAESPETVLRQWVLARWPADGGNLERFLETHDGQRL